MYTTVEYTVYWTSRDLSMGDDYSNIPLMQEGRPGSSTRTSYPIPHENVNFAHF